MEKTNLSLEERVKQLEQEVAQLKRLLETHLRNHGTPIRPGVPPKDPFHPDGPSRPDHPNGSPPRQL